MTLTSKSSNLSPYRTVYELVGNVAIITGASRGIGAAIAEALGAWGATVILTDIDQSALSTAKNTLIAQGIACDTALCDVTITEQVDDLIRSVSSKYGRLDVLVNNAGISARIPAEAYPDDALEQIIDINLKGVYRATRAAGRYWIDNRKQGNIINLASFAGLVADTLSAPYAATKGAVVQITRTCAVEWANHGIRVNAIAPGYVRTPMTSATLDSDAGKERIRISTPLGRAGTPQEIANAAVFLASNASAYVTGHVLCVDGGWTAQ